MRIVQYGAKWCPACPGVKRMLTRLCADNRVPFEYIDIDESPEVAELNITALPTIAVWYEGNGKPVVLSGAVNRGHLERLF